MTLKATEHDNRGDASTPFGFVYFNDGKRCLYAKGLHQIPNGASSGTGGWEPVTPAHVREAERYLAEQFGPDWFKS